MNSPIDNENDLNRALEHQVEHLDTAPLTLGDVQTRAKRIQRRRRIGACVAAAAAVAIIAPIGLILGNSQPDSSGPIKRPSTTPSAIAWPQRLQTDDPPLGDAPKIDWLEGTTLHTADGGTVTLDAAYFQFVPYDDGWLALGSTDSGDYSATVLDSEGTPVGEPFATGEGFAISDDGSRVLYVDNGDLVVHVNGGDTEVLLEGVGNTTEPIGFSGDSALYNIQRGNGESDGRWIEAGGPEHDPKPVGTYIYTDSTSDGWSAALTKVTDDGSCSQTTAPHGNSVGETCDFSLDSFSPDGANVLAGPAYRSGYGDGELAVVPRDHLNGNPPPLVHYVQSLETDATFMDARWEDDEHVLAVTSTPVPGSADRMFGIVRIGLDGSVENTVEPVRAEDVDNPFGFATP